jgi:hydrogen peroxide-dependent heme synthase
LRPVVGAAYIATEELIMASDQPTSSKVAKAFPGAGPGEPGWAVLHLYQRIDRGRWRKLPDPERRLGVEELSQLLARWQGEEGLQILTLGVIGKADFGLVAVHPEARRVQRLTQELAATRVGACLETVYSFLSLSEVSEYMSTAGDQARKLIDEQGLAPESPEFQQQVGSFARRMAAYAEARVHPELPGGDYPVVCFYPMAKSRGEERNWYALSFEERKRLMGQHADSGRRYAGRVTQLITSATGIDDWEWGVTLFARDLKSLRDIVYEMRYDEGSALYGQFGAFYVGVRFAPEELGEALQLST